MKNSKKFSMEERILKWTKRHKKRNSIYTGIIFVVALILLVFAMTSQKIEPVKAIGKAPNEISMTYLGNIELNNHIRKNNLNDAFASIKEILKGSDYSTASLEMTKFSDDRKTNISKNLENVLFLKGLNLKSLNVINQVTDNITARDFMKSVEAQTGYNYLTGNGSNPINSKTVQQTIKGKKIANVSFTDVESNYTDTLKNTTSVSLEPSIYMPLIKKLKENNDYVVVNVDWGITDERSVTTRQREYAHSLSEAGADVIIGHNSVVQEIEKYKNTDIFYSLGNTTSEDFLSKNKQGLAVQQTWNGKQSKFMITPIKSQGGKVTKSSPNVVEERKLLNNIESKNLDLKKENGGYVYEH
ncbi:capsule biosynthesis protein CapA [Staphylococcus saprophyticus]|uniref:Poly-gamma-glutamate synthesis protein PgsA n=2 Tax=Staphylococcus TaxID=1279 RepID=Q4A0B2_STAS1|nr:MULTISPECIES: CapA family protein [Staphylococcus]SIN55172.1 Bacterial capsule synthesis protein PGA_cap [Mycobacteroides abscessus subsp. abscessus]AMG19447.1 CapA family protein [Staphylococcus saprophyticus]AMG32561.1 CapA family protein [Staphylococcus saprophyticus]ASE58503.1 CapA family protein [Staphylococcus saprophyticus]ASF19471.1 CapA family protein [Staphylococcus saprophyticus]